MRLFSRIRVYSCRRRSLGRQINNKRSKGLHSFYHDHSVLYPESISMKRHYNVSLHLLLVESLPVGSPTIVCHLDFHQQRGYTDPFQSGRRAVISNQDILRPVSLLSQVFGSQTSPLSATSHSSMLRGGDRHVCGYRRRYYMVSIAFDEANWPYNLREARCEFVGYKKRTSTNPLLPSLNIMINMITVSLR